MIIVSFTIAEADLKRLDAMAGPRGRSKWLREAIGLHATYPGLIGYAEMKKLYDALHKTARVRGNKRARTV